MFKAHGLRFCLFAMCLQAVAQGTLPGAPASASPGNEIGLPEQLQAVRAQLDAHHPAAAEQMAHTVAQRNPESAEAAYLLAQMLTQNNHAAEALTAFTHAATLRPPSSEDLRLVGLDYVLLADTQDALHWLKESVLLDPRNVEAVYDLGRVQMTAGDYPAAEQSMRNALKLRPRLVKAENNLGLIQQALNDPADALVSYESALASQAEDLHPSEQPFLNLGLLLMSEGQSARAVPLLRNAVKIAPSDPQCYAALARALYQTDNRVDAVTLMSRAVVLDSANPRLHYQLGQMYRDLGDAGKAATEFKLSQKLYGQHSSEGIFGK